MAKLRILDFFFVLLQFVLFGLFLVSDQVWPEFMSLSFPKEVQWVGLGLVGLGALLIGIALLQLSDRLSPFPTPKGNARLLQNGVFKWMRHPIYTGILFVFSGWAFYRESANELLVSLALFILFFFKARYEERRLQEVFPDYAEYKKRTGRFLPRWIKRT